MSNFNFADDSDVIVLDSSDEEPLPIVEKKLAKTRNSFGITQYPKTKKPKIMLPKKNGCVKSVPQDLESRQIEKTVTQSQDSIFSAMSGTASNTAPKRSSIRIPQVVPEVECLDFEDELLDIDCGYAPRPSVLSEKFAKAAESVSNYHKLAVNANLPQPSAPTRSQKTCPSKEQKNKEMQQRKFLKEQEKKQRLEELERGKVLKQTENELRRNAKPGEAHKFITLVIDAQLPKLDDLTAYLVAAEIKNEICSSPIYRNSIIFKRELIHQAMGNDLKLQKVSTWEEEDQILVILPAEDFVSNLYVHVHKDEEEGPLDGIDVITFVETIQATCPGKHVTLIVVGMDKYFKKIKTTAQKEFRQRVESVNQKKRKKQAQLPVVSPIEFQSCMVELQLHTRITYRLVNNAEQLGKLLTQYLKAIADAPFKRQRKELGFDWFATAESAGSVKVEKDGQGLNLLWSEQLKQFGKVGIEIVQAITKIYPTPKALLDKYEQCESSDQALDLLRDINVWIGVGQLAKQRKIGPELSKKVYRFLTSRNADRCLGSSQSI